VAREKEAQRILHRLKPGDFVVVLDERGKAWSSADLARELTRWQNHHPSVALVIGGPEGLTDEVRQRANQVWSLSALTFPHGLVRVIVVEQLYRAWTILQGHPYHKD
jgi:23S rRNA (pseudouridine1915-N3)-methyltransferase